MSALGIYEREHLRRLAGFGGRELARLVLARKLTCSIAWVALKGAHCFRKALVEHGLAPAGVQQSRLDHCQQCPSSAVGKPGRHTGYRAASCGPLGNDRSGYPENPTCGCLVAVVDNAGNWIPAGKSVIDQGVEMTVAGKRISCSADCPQGRFGLDHQIEDDQTADHHKAGQ